MGGRAKATNGIKSLSLSNFDQVQADRKNRITEAVLMLLIIGLAASNCCEGLTGPVDEVRIG